MRPVASDPDTDYDDDDDAGDYEPQDMCPRCGQDLTLYDVACSWCGECVDCYDHHRCQEAEAETRRCLLPLSLQLDDDL